MGTSGVLPIAKRRMAGEGLNEPRESARGRKKGIADAMMGRKWRRKSGMSMSLILGGFESLSFMWLDQDFEDLGDKQAPTLNVPDCESRTLSFIPMTHRP